MTDIIMSLNENDLLYVIMYGNKNFDNNMNISILTATIKFIKDSERFDHGLINLFFNHYSNHSYSLFKLFVQEVCCITTRIFALISYIFNLTNEQ